MNNFVSSLNREILFNSNTCELALQTFYDIIHFAINKFIPKQRKYNSGSRYPVYSLENGYQVDAIYTDFSKAFDRVHHRLLLQKLWLYGIEGKLHNRLSSYIQHRQQQAFLNGYLSDSSIVSSGLES
ncbi:uncharacterized protein LOC135143786 [Zophobas morio]|uniref:uncharacterized protein LOC135143786 n=1 Tax=Zophobas morio TaxID=2755281 RepID=UPI003083018F